MSVFCLNTLSPGVMISAINSVAYNAFRNHKTGEQFTLEEQKQIYEDLIKTIQEDFWGGNMSDVFAPMMADRNLGNNKTHVATEEALISILMELQNSILTTSMLSARPRTTATEYAFPKAPTEIHYEIFNKFITKPKKIVTPTQLESQAESFDTPIEPSKFKDINTPSAIIKKALGDIGEEYMTPILTHLQDTVATTWVDGVVRSDGTVRGFAGLKKIATTVKGRLQSKVYNYLASRSNGTFETEAGRENIKYIVYTPDRVPFDFVSTTKDENAKVKVGEHTYFKSIATVNGSSKVRIVIAENMDEAITAITALSPTIKVKGVPVPNTSNAVDYNEFSITNPSGFSEEDLPVYYAHTLTTGENFITFLGAEYPSLAEAYRPKFKTSYAEPGTVSGPDQDSASLRIHKLATPRLVRTGDGQWAIDPESPYLTEGDFALVSPELSGFSSDKVAMAREIYKEIDTNESLHKQNILASIYYRFFHPDDYQMIDKSGNEITMRSYTGIAATQKMKPITVAEHAKSKRTGEKLESPNALLESSLSALVTSFRTIKPNDQVGERNGRLDMSNITGSGKNLWSFNADFVVATSTSSATGTVTNDKYFNNNRVLVTKAPDGPNGEPRFNLTINKVSAEISDSTKYPSISYLVQINLGKTEAGAPLEFQAGIPVTIIENKTNAPIDIVAEIFAGFGLPTMLTSKYYRSAVLDSVARARLENENNISLEDPSITLENLYVNMMFTMLLNGNDRLSAVSSLFSLATLPKIAEGANIAYNPIDVLYGYKDMLADIILHTEGELGSKHSQTYDGNRVAEFIQTSYFKLTSKLASIPTVLNQGNVLTTGEYIVGRETYGDKGMKLGDKTKSVETETEHEKISKAIEAAFVQSAARSRGNNTVLIKIGAQSDRLHPQFHQFTATKPGGIFLIEEEQGGWNTKQWERDAIELVKLDPSITSTMIAAIKSRDQLRILLEGRHIKYDDLKANNILLSYGRILEDEDGYAFVPADKKQDLRGLDVHALARKTLYVHQNYYTNLNTVALSEWNKALGTNFKTLQEVADELKTNKYFYDDIKADSELVNSSMITVEEIKEGNKKVRYARVPEDILQSIAIFSNDTLGLEYIETMRQMFMKQLASIGYTAISPASVKDVLDKIMGVSVSSQDAIRVATDIAFNAYFYNSQILGVSALNLHSGGVAQYDHKSRSNPLFSTAKSFKNGKLDIQGVLTQAQNLKVPGSKLTIGTISVKELLELRAKSAEAGPLKKSEFRLDRLAYMKAILTNESSFATDRNKAKALLLNDLTRHLSDKFVSQVKRNQVYGTAMQLPRLVHINEPGFLLGKSSKNITIIDEEPEIDVLGMSGVSSAKATDGVQMCHPLHILRVNNSLGNEESSFRNKGVASKDLTVSRDSNGSILTQKKATFGSFSDDHNKKGSVLIDQTLERMGTAVTFLSKQLAVDVKGPSKWEPIDTNGWLTHGLSYGWLLFKATPTAPGVMVHSSQLLAQLKSDPDTRTIAEQQIANKLYSTDKQVKTFNNIQELWEYFGATTNPEAWNHVADVIGYHSGLGTKQMDLSDANYPNRDAYIEKIGYVSQEKTGSKNTITWENFLDPNYQFTEVRGSKRINRWSEVSNEHHGYILQAEHNYDTTAPFTGLYSDDNEEQKANQVSLITQIISAASAEGMSIREANAINDTIGTLSDAALEGLNSKIAIMTIKEHPDLAKTENIKQILIDSLTKGIDKNNTDTPYAAELFDGAQEYARQLVARSLAKKESDTGLSAELLTIQYKASLTFDQKQLLPLFQSQLFNDFNKKTVRMKMPGGQFVVSPSHGFMPSYDLYQPHPSGNGKNGKLLLSGLNREDMNKMFYGSTFENLTQLQKNAIDHSFPMAPITDLSKVKLSDTIVKYDGFTVPFNTVKQQFKAEYDITPNPEISFNQFLLSKIVENNYQFRFGNITRETEKANKLRWAKWIRFDAEGNELNITETPEYRAYNEIDPIGKSFLDGKTASEHFGLPAQAPVSTKKQTKAKMHARSAEVINAIRTRVPLGLIREYYFGTFNTETKILDAPTRMISPAQELEFAAWLGKQDLVAVVDSMYKYIGEKASVNPKYRKVFEAKVYTLLQDDAQGWVSAPAETYMPHMHASTFLMRDGKDGSPADSLFTFTGLNEMPSTSRMESTRWLNPATGKLEPIMKRETAVAFSLNFDEAFENFKTNLDGDYHKLPDSAKDIFDEYVKTIELMRSHLTDVFKERVGELYGIEAKEDLDDSKIAAPGNLFVFADMSIDKMLPIAIRRRNSSIVGSAHYNVMSDLIIRLENAKTLQNLEIQPETTYDILNDIRNSFINNKVKTLTNSFQKTLEFIMARIPAQGKQSFIHAKIKNFIFSSKNSVYGPLELILIAGLDYDIDKQNMMTWGLDEEGNIIDWKQYMINGKIDVKTLNRKIAQSASIIKAAFAADKVRLEARLKDIEDKLKSAPDGGPALDELGKAKTRIQNYLTAGDSNLEDALEKSEEANRVMFTKAGQNFIVHNLLETIGSPKNAIETNTPATTTKVAEAKIQSNIDHLFNSSIGLEDLFLSQQITSNVNPYSTTQYEKINMDGKSGIGIYAADLKAYLAAYYATRMAEDDVVDVNGIVIRKGEKSRVQLKSDIITIPEKFVEKFNINKNALQFFKPNGEVVTMSFLANAEKWSQKGKSITAEATKALAELKTIDVNDTAAQYELVLRFADSVGIMNSMNVDEQAWEDLSQLLTASTDNAKELILGKIGANNTTNSLISTMVRMGVDLSDAIPLINDPRIKYIVKEIEKGTDLKVKSAEDHRLAMEGIVLEEAFNSRLSERLKKELPAVPTDGSNDATVQAYLTDPIRLLYTYANIAAEFSSLTRLLGINQGLKNSAYEVYAYVTGINDAINKSISDYNDAHKGSEITLTFDLQRFVTMVSNKKEAAKVTELLDAMDKIRTGINVPFILVKNAHYFSYFKALFQAENIRNRLSFTNQYTANIIEAAKLKYKKKSQVMTDKVYKKISDTIYDFGILSFLEEIKGEKSPLTLRGNTYDLSKSQGNGKVFGRTELLQHLPDILKGISGNAFVDSLKYNQLEIDPMTGVNVPILKGKDLALIDSIEYTRLANGLRQLATDYPDIYSALFYYSLITTKGGYGGGSFAGLFDINEYLAFSKFLKKELKTIKTNINNHRDLTFLLNPLLLPQVTTIAPPTKATYDIELDQDDISGMLDVGYAEDEAGYELGNNSAVYWKNLNKEKFRLDHLNEEKKLRNTKLDSDFFRSKSNGMRYHWHMDLGIWIPLTSDIPNLGIPWNLIRPDQDYISIVEEAGLTHGFTITMPDVIPVMDAEEKTFLKFNKGAVIAYISSEMKQAATRYFEALEKNPETAKTTLTPTMLGILQKEVARDPKQFSYIVESATGSYHVYTDKQLAKYNPGFVFEEGFIAAGSKILDNTEVKESPKTRIYAKDSQYYSEPPKGWIRNVDPFYDVVIEYQAHESSPVQFYNQELINKVLSEIDQKAIADAQSISNVEDTYKQYVNHLVDRMLILSNEESIQTLADAKRIREAGNAVGYTLSALVVKTIGQVNKQLGGAKVSLVSKIKTLQKGSEEFIDNLTALQGRKVDVPEGTPDISYLSKDNIPAAAVDLLASKNAVTQLRLIEFRELLKIVGADKSVFDTFITGTYLPKSGVDIMTRQDGFIYARTGVKISASKQLASIEDRINKNKPIYLPPSMKYEYTKPANKAILYSMTRFLNSRLSGVKWNLMTSEQIKEKFGTKYMTDKGMFKADGEIIINIDKATIETPLHEFGHVYLQYLMEENLEEYQKLMNLAKSHTLYKTMGNTYKGISSIDLAEEVFCELLSMSAANKIITNKGGITEEIINSVSDSTGIFGKVIGTLKSWIQSMFARAGLKRSISGVSVEIDLSLNDTLGKVIDNLSDEVLFGKESILSNFSDETKEQIRKTRTNATLTIKEARDILLARGYIEWYCVS